MTSKSDENGAPIDAAAWIAQLRENIAVARAGADPEGVHRVRVAAGRLDVWLRMIEWRVLRDDLRWLRGAASDVRDLDVLLERELPSAFAEWLRAERTAARTKLLSAFDLPRCAALLRALEVVPTFARESGRPYVKRERRRVEERGRATECEDADVAEMHRLRRAVRRLRYAREALGLGTRRIKSLQDELGRLNDAAVALAHLDHCPRAAELTDLRLQLGDEVRRAFEGAQAAWRNARLDCGEDDA